MRKITLALCNENYMHSTLCKYIGSWPQPLLPKKHLIISGVGKELVICLIFIFSPSLSYSLVFPIPFWVEYLFLVSHPMLVNVEKLPLVTTQMTYCLLLNFSVFTTLYFLWKYINILWCLRETGKDILLALLIMYFPLSSRIFCDDQWHMSSTPSLDWFHCLTL